MNLWLQMSVLAELNTSWNVSPKWKINPKIMNRKSADPLWLWCLRGVHTQQQQLNTLWASLCSSANRWTSEHLNVSEVTFTPVGTSLHIINFEPHKGHLIRELSQSIRERFLFPPVTQQVFFTDHCSFSDYLLSTSSVQALFWALEIGVNKANKAPALVELMFSEGTDLESSITHKLHITLASSDHYEWA